MLFQSIEFGILLIAVFFAGWSAVKLPLVRKYILIIAGIVFLGYGSKILALFLMVSSLSTWYFGRAILQSTDQIVRRNLLTAGISLNLVLLLVAKTGNVSGLERLLAVSPGDPLSLTSAGGYMTYGVIFFTLQATGYLIDIYRREIVDEVPFEDVLLLVTYFPKLVAGPLVNNSRFLSGIGTALSVERIDASRAFYFILRGLFKKVVLANYLAVRIVDPFFNSPAGFSSFDAVVAVFAFTLQFYWNLSGLFDTGRGVSLLLGFELESNYERPFTAGSFKGFIVSFNSTFTGWLKKYVASPLRSWAGEREWILLTVPAFLGGLWYGSGFNALFIGAIAAVVLLIEKKLMSSPLTTEDSPLSSPLITEDSLLKKVLTVIYTIVVVSFILVFLRAGSVPEAFGVFGAMFRFSSSAIQTDALLLTVVLWGFAVQFIPHGWSSVWVERLSWLHPLTQAVVIGFIVVLISSLGTGNFPNLLHFAF